ncbi:MAG: DUF1223 domain-containing protein [Pseudomonadota bacterium]
MRPLLTWIAAGLMLALPSHAGDRPVVVELYTSQGCSSCPPADAFLHELAERDDVLALAMHVDYWDYIGWKDSFARPEHTARQRAYAKADGRRMIYTPQMIIDGQDHVIGNRPKDVLDVIKAHRARPDTVALEVRREGEEIVISADRLDGAADPLRVQLVRYAPRDTVDILRGENAGRTLSYANIVTDMRVLGTWGGSAPLNIRETVTGDAPVVVVLQSDDGAGRVEAAMELR